MRNLHPGTLALAAALAVTLACGSARDVAEGGGSGCATCHGYPPPPFVAGGSSHTTETNCHACHAGTVQADNVTLVPGGLHLDGIVQGAGHPAGYVAPSVHGPDAIAFLAGAPGASACTACHGADYSGGLGPSCNACHAAADAGRPNFPAGVADWRANCTFCHGTPTEPYPTIANPVLAAPPQSVAGATDPALPRVGAHQRHLQGGSVSGAFTCATCHSVPADLSHVNGTVPVAPSGAGQRQLPASLGTYTAATQTCAVYCHGSTITTPAPAPSWTAAGTLACNACHASRPTSGGSSGHQLGNHVGAPCAFCHKGYVQDTSVDLTIHVDGQKTVVFDNRGGGTTTSTTVGASGTWSCAVCHTAGATGNVNAPGFLP